MKTVALDSLELNASLTFFLEKSISIRFTSSYEITVKKINTEKTLFSTWKYVLEHILAGLQDCVRVRIACYIMRITFDLSSSESKFELFNTSGRLQKHSWSLLSCYICYKRYNQTFVIRFRTRELHCCLLLYTSSYIYEVEINFPA